MSRFISKILLLLLPIAVLSVSMEYLLRLIPNDYAQKRNYFENHSKEIQVLILGSSETYYGINPEYITHNTFNAGYISQSLDLDYEIFNKFQNNLDGLKVIVIPMSYHTLWRRLKNSVESWRLKNYAIYYGIDTKSLSDHSEIMNGKLGINLNRLYEYYIRKNDGISSSESGWGTSYRSEIGNDLETTAKTAILRHTQDINSSGSATLLTENMEILNTFAKICNQKNIELMLLAIPVSEVYRDNLDTKRMDEITELMNAFASKHNRCHYIYWSDSPDFSNEDFYDADHLNDAGAKKLSEKISIYIDSLGIFD